MNKYISGSCDPRVDAYAWCQPWAAATWQGRVCHHALGEYRCNVYVKNSCKHIFFMFKKENISYVLKVFIWLKK